MSRFYCIHVTDQGLPIQHILKAGVKNKVRVYCSY